MTTYIISEPVTRSRIQEIANERFGDLVKGVVDIEKQLLIVGPELHIDGASELQRLHGSTSNALWGVNFYPGQQGEAFLEYNSMINLKPAVGNRTRGVDDPATRDAILRVVRVKITDSGL